MMSKPPFYLAWPQSIYELLQRYRWLPLVGSLGIAILALVSFIPGLPGSQGKSSPTLAAIAWIPTDTPFPMPATEVVLLPIETPTWTPAPTEFVLPTFPPYFTPTQVIPTEPFDFIDPDISQWPVMIFDTFDTNDNSWFVGETDATYIDGENLITEGKYRWDWTAKQGIHYRGTPNMEDVADFNLSVDARRVEGNPGTYGLIFRDVQDGKFYYFWVNDATQEFGVAFSNGEGGWTTLMGNTFSSKIRPGDVNQLEVTATGSVFHFYINNQYMGEVIDDNVSAGIVGLAAELLAAGDASIYEFDNFVLRAPAQSTELTTPSSILTLTSTPTQTTTQTLLPGASPTSTPTSPAPPTNPPEPTKEPTKKPAPKPTKTPAPPGEPTNTPANP